MTSHVSNNNTGGIPISLKKVDVVYPCSAQKVEVGSPSPQEGEGSTPIALKKLLMASPISPKRVRVASPSYLFRRWRLHPQLSRTVKAAPQISPKNVYYIISVYMYDVMYM